MALSFRTPTSRSVGLDLDGGYLAAVSTSHGQVERAASTELAPGLMREGEVVDAHGLAASIKAFFRAHELPRNVRLGVANQQIAVRQLELPKIADERDLAAAVRFQAADTIAMPLDEAALDFQVVGETTSPEGVARMRLVVVAARNEMIGRFVQAVREAGLKPEGIDLDAFALVRALAPQADPTGEARVYCHLGGLTNLAVAIGPTCLFTRTLDTVVEPGAATAPSAVTAAPAQPAPEEPVAEESSAPAAPSEAFKPGPADEIAAVEAAALAALEAAGERAEGAEPESGAARRPRQLDPQVVALSEEIRMSIDFYMAQPEAREASQLIVSGPGSQREGIAEQLGEALSLPVSVAAPLGADDGAAMPAGDDPYRYTVATGLALGGRE